MPFQFTCQQCGRPFDRDERKQAFYCSLKCRNAAYRGRPRSPRENKLRKPLTERFWAKVKKTENCWLWTGWCNAAGYGALGRGRRSEGLVLAHRLSWELAHTRARHHGYP